METVFEYSTLLLRHAVAKVLSHRPHTAQAQIHPKPVHVGCVVGKGTVFLQVLQFSLISIISPKFHTHISFNYY